MPCAVGNDQHPLHPLFQRLCRKYLPLAFVEKQNLTIKMLAETTAISQIVDTIQTNIIRLLLTFCVNEVLIVHCRCQNDVYLLAAFNKVLCVLGLKKSNGIICKVDKAERQRKTDARAQYSVQWNLRNNHHKTN